MRWQQAKRNLGYGRFLTPHTTRAASTAYQSPLQSVLRCTLLPALRHALHCARLLDSFLRTSLMVLLHTCYTCGCWPHTASVLSLCCMACAHPAALGRSSLIRDLLPAAL